MGEMTAIQWCHHTFNIAWGCTKVSAGCVNCYADSWAKRTGRELWGPNAERRTFGEKHWREPLKWNRDAEREGRRHRVFCSSMADVFEDHPTIEAEQSKLWKLIAVTPHLDWLLLTKRSERIRELAPARPFPNVWLGVSVEDQATADARIPHLLATPAAVRFVSAEPLLGPVDLTRIATGLDDPTHGNVLDDNGGETALLDWVIVGGESGPGARECRLAWVRSIVDQCRTAGTACFVKQLGARPVYRRDDLSDDQFTDLDASEDGYDRGPVIPRLRDRKGGDMREWPEDLRVLEFPA